MVGKGVKAGTRTTEVIGSWGHPFVFTSNFDQLVCAESGEWNVPWSTLSLLVLFFCCWRISLLEMLFQELGILKGSLCIRTEGQDFRGQSKTQDGGCKFHDVRGLSSQDSAVM